MKLAAEFIDATRIADYCSGACLLMRRQVFLDLGGFDPIFDPACCWDVDLGIRLRSIGLFTYYCGASVVYHEESVTSTRSGRPKNALATLRQITNGSCSAGVAIWNGGWSKTSRSRNRYLQSTGSPKNSRRRTTLSCCIHPGR